MNLTSYRLTLRNFDFWDAPMEKVVACHQVPKLGKGKKSNGERAGEQVQAHIQVLQRGHIGKTRGYCSG